MDAQKIFDLLNRIELNMDSVYVREGSQNVLLSELPAPAALKWVFKWIREELEKE